MQKKWTKWVCYLPSLLFVLIFLLFIGLIYFAYQWRIASTLNSTYKKKSLFAQTLVECNPKIALMQAFLLGQRSQTSETIKQTLHALAIAEAAKDLDIRAQAKFAIGNLYFDLSAISADIEAGGSHQQAVAQLTLAREAYKGALRLKPEMYDARFNLELLDRLSPEKRTQAWLAETDGVTLQPFKRNGTAMMKDNKRRGLP